MALGMKDVPKPQTPAAPLPYHILPVHFLALPPGICFAHKITIRHPNHLGFLPECCFP